MTLSGGAEGTPPPTERAIIEIVNDDHNELSRSLDALWQCLSQSKRPLGVFLGAGSPAAIRISAGEGTRPLIPDIAGLTEAVNKEILDSELKAAHATLIQGLKEDLERPPNIEDMLTRLRTLATVVGGHSVRDLHASAIEKLEKAITQGITKQVSVALPQPPTPYDDLAIWIGSANRTSPVRLFTTNYDLLAEEALERNDVPFFDGFVGVEQPFLDTRSVEMDDLPSRWTRVWKLHGSANWTLLRNGRVVRRAPNSAEEQRLIHPSHLKYDESRRMPYLVMQDQLRGFLREQSSTLVIVGYSFGDLHINELIDQGLRGNPTSTAFALQHGDLEKYERAGRLASAWPSLALLARDGGIVAGRRTPWRTNSAGEATECKLGDFLEFGKYLRRLVGPRPLSQDQNNVDDG